LRIVLKIGSSSLNHPQGGLDDTAVEDVVRAIAGLRQKGHECVLVSSGAVAAGMGKLGMVSRPQDLAGKQAAAAVGQGVLMERYAYHLEQHGLIGAQVLLSRLDLAEPSRYRNAQNTLAKLIRLGVVPIINENDTVAVEELCFGDNDRLSALVAGLVHADTLVIFTDVEGLYTANPREDSGARLIRKVEDVNEVMGLGGASGSQLGTGGMVTKLRAAEMAVRYGIGMFLLHGRHIGNLPAILEGRVSAGTYFVPTAHRLSGRKRWIAYAGLSEGTIRVDDGAAKALLNEGKSLLPKGITGVEGHWERKELVKIVDPAGQEIARGLAELNSDEVIQVMGRHSEEMLRLIPDLNGEEVVHRDNMTLMVDPGAK